MTLFKQHHPMRPKRDTRPSPSMRGLGVRHRHWARMVLDRDPVCVLCEVDGRTEPATEADHIIARRDRPDLQYDLDNGQGLCKRCHSRKTIVGG